MKDYDIVDWKQGRGKDILILMELKENVASAMRGRERMSDDEVIKLGIHICRALEYCDRHGLIHRDIKPETIFTSKFGDYKLGEFGAVWSSEWADTPKATVGTPAFMAPEVVFLDKPYDARADICSLGLTMYYLLNGKKLPFEGEYCDIAPISRRLYDGEPPPVLDWVGDKLMSIVLKACASNPEDRYCNAAEMRKALKRVKSSTKWKKRTP